MIILPTICQSVTYRFNLYMLSAQYWYINFPQTVVFSSEKVDADSNLNRVFKVLIGIQKILRKESREKNKDEKWKEKI